MKKPLLISAVLWCFISPALAADDPGQGIESKTFTVTARACESPLLKYRLFPAEYELKEGNAAPILLRLAWDQQPFMNQIVPQLVGMLEIPISDIDRIRAAGKEVNFDYLYSEMRRAAYRRTADWEYPLNEALATDIRLPDVQGSRDFTRALAVWIRMQIVDEKLDAAREGILVGLANTRHHAQTPFLIIQLVANVHAITISDRLIELLQQPKCPNFYWAMTMLPSPLLKVRQSCQFEWDVLRRSVEGLNDLDRPRSPDQWQELAARLIQVLSDVSKPKFDTVAPDEIEAKRRLMPKWARQDLPRIDPGIAARIPEMCDAEILVRWLLATNTRNFDRAVAAAAQGTRDAMERLRADAKEMAEFEKKWALAGGFLVEAAYSACIVSIRLERRFAALRVVEAVRHYAATHGVVPATLDQLSETAAPPDPFTGQPFSYERTEDRAAFVLTAPPAKRLDGELRSMSGIDWLVKVSKP